MYVAISKIIAYYILNLLLKLQKVLTESHQRLGQPEAV